MRTTRAAKRRQRRLSGHWPYRATFHFPVLSLVLPRTFPLGPVTFRPAGWLGERVAAADGDVARSVQGETEDADPAAVNVRRAQDEVLCWATASAAAHDVATARALVDDAIAILRLYQRWTHRILSMDGQYFGLGRDTSSPLEWYWVMTGRRLRGTGGQRYGHLASWEFTRQSLDDFRGDPAFAYLADAFAARRRDEWQRRVVSAVRAVSFSITVDRPQMRIAVVSLALEVLLSDGSLGDVDERGVPLITGSHEIARRVAFLTCSAHDPIVPGRPECLGDPCYLLRSTSERAMRTEGGERRAAGLPTVCSAYAYGRAVFTDRNLLMHQGKDDFTEREAGNHLFHVDQVLWATLSWVAGSGATSLADLRGALARATDV